MDKFTVGEAVSYGWEAFKANALTLIGIMVISSMLNSIPNVFVQITGKENAASLPYYILLAVIWLFSILISCGMIRILLDIYDGREVDFVSLFTTLDPFLNFLLGSIVVGIAVTIGTILLIIPGIYLAIRFSMFPFAVVDEGLGAIDAIQRSWEMTEGQVLNLLLLGLAFIGIEIAGFIALCVGLFVAVPVTMMASVYVYRQLQSKGGLVY